MICLSLVVARRQVLRVEFVAQQCLFSFFLLLPVPLRMGFSAHGDVVSFSSCLSGCSFHLYIPFFLLFPVERMFSGCACLSSCFCSPTTGSGCLPFVPHLYIPFFFLFPVPLRMCFQHVFMDVVPQTSPSQQESVQGLVPAPALTNSIKSVYMTFRDEEPIPAHFGDLVYLWALWSCIDRKSVV